MRPRFLLSCSFRPRTAAAIPLLDRLVGGTPDPGRVVAGVVTRGWVVRGERRAEQARGRLAATPGVWAVALDVWPDLRAVA